MEGRLCGTGIKTQNIKPTLRQFVLFVRHRPVNTDRVKITRQDDIAHVGAHAVIQMQAAAHIADMFFDIPDGFAAAATAAKQRQIVAVTLRVIAGYRGLTTLIYPRRLVRQSASVHRDSPSMKAG